MIFTHSKISPKLHSHILNNMHQLSKLQEKNLQKPRQQHETKSMMKFCYLNIICIKIEGLMKIKFR